MAAQRLAQTKPPTGVPSAAPGSVAAAPAVPRTGAPAVGAASQLPQAVPQAMPPASRPPAPEANPFDTATVVAKAVDPFDPQKTVMVERPVIPSQARGPTKT